MIRSFFYSFKGIWFVVSATWGFCNMAWGVIAFSFTNVIATLAGALLPWLYVITYRVLWQLMALACGVADPAVEPPPQFRAPERRLHRFLRRRV